MGEILFHRPFGMRSLDLEFESGMVIGCRDRRDTTREWTHACTLLRFTLSPFTRIT